MSKFPKEDEKCERCGGLIYREDSGHFGETETGFFCSECYTDEEIENHERVLDALNEPISEDE